MAARRQDRLSNWIFHVLRHVDHSDDHFLVAQVRFFLSFFSLSLSSSSNIVMLARKLIVRLVHNESVHDTGQRLDVRRWYQPNCGRHLRWKRCFYQETKRRLKCSIKKRINNREKMKPNRYTRCL